MPKNKVTLSALDDFLSPDSKPIEQSPTVVEEPKTNDNNESFPSLVEYISNDITTSNSDITTSQLQSDKLITIIKTISEVEASNFITPVRLSQKEKDDINDFIYDTLRKEKIEGRDVSMSKLMRYCIRYMIKVHQDEFVKALKEALEKNVDLDI